jgi:hypothetical protein
MGILEIIGGVIAAIIGAIGWGLHQRRIGRDEGAKMERDDARKDDMDRARAIRERVRAAERGQYADRGFRK